MLASAAAASVTGKHKQHKVDKEKKKEARVGSKVVKGTAKAAGAVKASKPVEKHRPGSAKPSSPAPVADRGAVPTLRPSGPASPDAGGLIKVTPPTAAASSGSERESASGRVKQRRGVDSTAQAAVSDTTTADDDVLEAMAGLSLSSKQQRRENRAASSGQAKSKLFKGDRKPLRDYQARLVRDFDAALAGDTQSVLLYLPTGAGKTRVAAELIGREAGAGRRSMFVVNRNALVDQTHAALSELGLGEVVGFIKATYPRKKDALVQIASIQSLRAKRNTGSGGAGGADASGDAWPPADLVVIDEAHCAVAPSYLRMCEHYLQAGAVVVGLSATPVRLDPRENLGRVFDELIMGPSVSELVRRKVLAPPVVYGVDAGNVLDMLRSAKVRKGEISSEEVTSHLASDEGIRACVEAWQSHAKGRRTLCFCVSLTHSRALVSAFKSAGVSAAHVDGQTPQADRAELYRRFSQGSLTVLSSVNVLSEGFDEPRVDCVALLRPTSSKGLYIQQVGRGLRSAPLKTDCVVLDGSGNTWMHGSVTGPQGYSLEAARSVAPSRLKSARDALVKLCEERYGGCGAVVHRSYRRCDHCGRSFDVDDEDLSRSLAGISLSRDAPQPMRRLVTRAPHSQNRSTELGKVSLFAVHDLSEERSCSDSDSDSSTEARPTRMMAPATHVRSSSTQAAPRAARTAHGEGAVAAPRTTTEKFHRACEASRIAPATFDVVASNSWERSFLGSVRQQLMMGRKLSERQRAVLLRIGDKAKARPHTPTAASYDDLMRAKLAAETGGGSAAKAPQPPVAARSAAAAAPRAAAPASVAPPPLPARRYDPRVFQSGRPANSWERKFLASVRQQVEGRGREPTEKQLAILLRIQARGLTA